VYLGEPRKAEGSLMYSMHATRILEASTCDANKRGGGGLGPIASCRCGRLAFTPAPCHTTPCLLPHPQAIQRRGAAPRPSIWTAAIFTATPVAFDVCNSHGMYATTGYLPIVILCTPLPCFPTLVMSHFPFVSSQSIRPGVDPPLCSSPLTSKRGW